MADDGLKKGPAPASAAAASCLNSERRPAVADHPAAEILSAWRTVIEDVNGLATERTPISTAVPRLLAAVEAALKFHERHPLYGNASTDDEPDACPHDPDAPEHFEDADEPGEWLCGGKYEGDACSGCSGGPDGEYADWPCPEYEAILAALTGDSDG